MNRSHSLFTLAILAVLALVSAAPPHQLPPCIHTPFEGITHTTPDGTLIGEPDARDWGCVEHGPGVGHGAARIAPPARVGRAPVDPVPQGVPVVPPTDICLLPAAPNPATGATRIEFTLPASAAVNVSVYARRAHGPEKSFVVRTLVDATLAAGTFIINWDLSGDDGNRLDPGIYRVVLVVGDEALCGDIEVE